MKRALGGGVGGGGGMADRGSSKFDVFSLKCDNELKKIRLIVNVTFSYSQNIFYLRNNASIKMIL